MRYFSEDPITVTKKPLYDIFLQMEEDKTRWYQKAWELFQVPMVTDVYMPPVTFMLAYCFDRARGTMSWGNWLRLPFNYHVGYELRDDQVLLSGPIVNFGWGLLSGSEPIKPPNFKSIEGVVLESHNEMPFLPPGP